jgi:4'-phosphopantetheinyl transferase
MLVMSRQPEPGIQLAVWQVRESEDFYQSDLHWGAHELAELAAHKSPERRLEWLASRWLLHRMSGADARFVLHKDAYLRPSFLERPDWHCSLSHSHGYVAAALSTEGAVSGCDLQLVVSKISRIAHKFMRPDELEVMAHYPKEQHMLIQHLYWSAKEALYKAYGLRAVDFKAHLYLGPFEWHPGGVALEGWVRKSNINAAYRLYIGHVITHEHPEGLVWAVAAT